MARKLRRPDQPAWLQGLLAAYEFAASLKLAVVLIFASAAALALATFVESAYGLRAVHFGIYGTWWFTALNVLLAINIFCAASIRYPWKRHQTGFVITHIGLLLLLLGCAQSRGLPLPGWLKSYSPPGIDAQIVLFEGGKDNVAYEEDELIALRITSETGGQPEVVEIPFRGGPFNWSDFDGHGAATGSVSKAVTDSSLRGLYSFLWRLSGVDRGMLYDRDGVQLEVLDYYSNSELVDAPYVKLLMQVPSMPTAAVEGPPESAPDTPEELVEGEAVPVELSITPSRLPDFPQGAGDRENRGGGAFTFQLALSAAEREAFLQSAPEGELGSQGQVVLYVQGRAHRFLVQDKLGQGRFALPDSNVEVELQTFLDDALPAPDSQTAGFHIVANPQSEAPNANPAVELLVYRGDEPPDRMVLFADWPELQLQARRLEVFGSYWFDHGEKTAEELLQGQGGSRLDLLCGEDGLLYYRYWNRKRVVFAEELPVEAIRPAFTMPIAQLHLQVKRFLPRSDLGQETLPIAFDKATIPVSAFRAARLRLTVDGRSEEFWLQGAPPDPLRKTLGPAELHRVQGQGRHVEVSLPLRQFELGYDVALRDFVQKLDPGTSQPSHFSSRISLLDHESSQPVQDNVWITMNAPVDIRDPLTDRSYRLFQESFLGPWGPGESIYEALVGGRSEREQLYASVLTVNYDPGRGLKYLGSLTVCAGIATMFYMRAYFFKSKRRAPSSPSAAEREGRGRAKANRSR